MDCREAKKLLPLWIGQDLPDSGSSADVARHLEQCPSCERYRTELQLSLEALQCSISEAYSIQLPRHSVWPKLVGRISDWERDQHRERFNGWIPASVMALAVALMVAVSIPSLQEELFGNGANVANSVNLFDFDSEFRLDHVAPRNPDSGGALPVQGPAYGTAVNYKHTHEEDRKVDQW